MFKRQSMKKSTPCLMLFSSYFVHFQALENPMKKIVWGKNPEETNDIQNDTQELISNSIITI